MKTLRSAQSIRLGLTGVNSLHMVCDPLTLLSIKNRMPELVHDLVHNVVCNGRKTRLIAGRTVFDHADDLGVKVPTSCQRNGDCHECVVEIRRGMDLLSPKSAPEKFLNDDYRLACQATMADAGGDVEFALLRRQPRILTKSNLPPQPVDSPVTRRGDEVFFESEPIDAYGGRMLGLAIDLGTTTVVLNLADLETSAVLYTASFENPQRFGGSDIMHRISYEAGPYQGEMQKAILAAVNFEIGDIAKRNKIRRRQIYEVVVVGNATMRDIFFGIDVQSLGETPYRSKSEQEFRDKLRDTTAIACKAKALGLRVHPKANVYGGPLIASHVGADITADLLAVGMDEATEPVMLVDIGTNTEIVIGTKDRMLAASCPAGPAFEGRGVGYGMPGYHGAVESVEFNGEGIVCRTIGDARARGICGSGLIDLLAELRRTDQMTEVGQLEKGTAQFEFCADPPMSISRADISALAQAKSANYSGQYIVLRQFGLPLEKIGKLYLAGGFANYINVNNATAIGLVADYPPERIVKVGNASLAGATMMLLSQGKRRKMEALASRIEHIELESTPDFFDIFVEGCMFKPLTTEPL